LLATFDEKIPAKANSGRASLMANQCGTFSRESDHSQNDVAARDSGTQA
jgi:hypothetical protein